MIFCQNVIKQASDQYTYFRTINQVIKCCKVIKIINILGFFTPTRNKKKTLKFKSIVNKNFLESKNFY